MKRMEEKFPVGCTAVENDKLHFCSPEKRFLPGNFRNFRLNSSGFQKVQQFPDFLEPFLEGTCEAEALEAMENCIADSVRSGDRNEQAAIKSIYQ